MARVDTYLVRLQNLDDDLAELPFVERVKKVDPRKRVPGFGRPIAQGDDRWFEVDVPAGVDLGGHMGLEEMFGDVCTVEGRSCENVSEGASGQVDRVDMALFELFDMSPAERRRYEKG